MTASEFSALLVLATATSFTPGPNTTLSTALAANFGLRHSLRFVCAVPVGWGLLLVSFASSLGALMAFLAARYLLRDAIQERFGKALAPINDGVKKDGTFYLLTLRLVPLFPFFLVNLVPAFVGVPLATYVLTTFFGIMPGTAVFSLAGAGLGSVLDQGGAVSPGSILTPQIIGGLVGLAALSLAAIPIRKRLAARENQTGA